MQINYQILTYNDKLAVFKILNQLSLYKFAQTGLSDNCFWPAYIENPGHHFIQGF